jgi:hypothetical protein
MAQYAILIFAPARSDDDSLNPEHQKAHQRHADELVELGGTMLTAFELQPSTTATSLRGDIVTDGPFLDAKEVIAGFYVIEAADLDAALEIARRNPVLQQGGGVEVRPVRSGFVAPPEQG